MASEAQSQHNRELVAVLDNLDTFFKALCAGAKLEHLKYGFIHREPKGIVAIDQKGGGPGLKQTRLYAYPDQTTQIIHVITIGDKNSQKADIKYSREFADDLSKTQEH